ncbi:MAG: glycosyltransferase family 39 protein [Spirochaetota bacterium]|nr:glycosyltransferase family 39 protein [Spirochaetota bacterium]
MKITEKNIQIFFILSIILLAIYFIISAYNTQMLGEDESLYKFLGEEFSKPEPIKYFSYTFGKEIPLIQAIFVPLLSSVLFIIFGSSLVLGKIIVSIFAILTIIIVYLIGKRYNIWYGVVSAFLLMTITYFSFYSLLFYLEVPIAFFSALVTYIILKFSDSFKKWVGIQIGTIILGIILVITYFTKFSGLIEFIIVLVYFISLYITSKNKNYLKNLLITVLIFIVFISPYLIRNLILYKYPFFEPINFLFKYDNSASFFLSITPEWMAKAMSTISPVTLSLNNIISSLSLVPFILSIFGISYFLASKDKSKDEDKALFLLIVSTILFLLVFAISLLSVYTILEYRHFSIIYPQIALLGGFFLWKLKEFKQVFTLIIVAVIIFGLYTSIITVGSTSTQLKYSKPYVEGLTWIKHNTPEDSSLFTTYMGSVMEYANRKKVIWTIDEFPEIMTANDGKFIYDSLKKYNVSYILIWNPLLSEDYIIPHANLIGVFTFNFKDKISTNTNFNLIFSNSEVLIYELVL